MSRLYIEKILHFDYGISMDSRPTNLSEVTENHAFYVIIKRILLKPSIQTHFPVKTVIQCKLEYKNR